MTMGLPCDRDGYDLRMIPCPKCGSRGCPELHRYNGKCSADKPAPAQPPTTRGNPMIARIIASLKRIYASYKARQELPPPRSSMGE